MLLKLAPGFWSVLKYYLPDCVCMFVCVWCFNIGCSIFGMYRDLFSIYVFIHFTCFIHLLWHGVCVIEEFTDVAFYNLYDFIFYIYVSNSFEVYCCVGVRNASASLIRKPITFLPLKCHLYRVQNFHKYPGYFWAFILFRLSVCLFMCQYHEFSLKTYIVVQYLLQNSEDIPKGSKSDTMVTPVPTSQLKKELLTITLKPFVLPPAPPQTGTNTVSFDWKGQR